METVTFTWKHGGTNVLLAGTFNNWTGEKMEKVVQENGGVWWVLNKPLKKGAYQYKFIRDGEWCFDSAMPFVAEGQAVNNVVSVGLNIAVPFWWKLAGTNVSTTGSFKNWQENIPMKQIGHNNFYLEIPLPLGKYQYKFLVDGTWRYDDHQNHEYFDGIMNNFREVKTGKLELYYFQKDKFGVHYLAYIPIGYEDGNDWPLLLFMHGSGEKGTDIAVLESQGIPKELKHGRSLPFIILMPQIPKNSKWSAPIVQDFLEKLIDEWVVTRNVDKSRIYLTGVSMGGYGTWNLATRCPRKFAAIAPFCGGGDHLKVDTIKHIPVWAFHNRFDPIVPCIETTEDMVHHLQKVGGNVKFTIKDSSDHDCWSEVYKGQELFDWFLSHSIKDNSNNKKS